MNDKDQIKELFSKKLGNYEAKVNPALWENIASQVGAQSTTAATGLSLISKVIIGSIAAASVIGIITYSLSDSPKVTTPSDEQISENKTEVIENQQDITIEKEDVELQKVIQSENRRAETTESIEENTAPIEVEEPLISNDNNVSEVNDVAETNTDQSEQSNQTDNSLEEKTEENTPLPKIEPQKTGEPLNNETVENKDVPEPPTVSESYTIEKLPNVFSPNNDGSNDIFFIKNTGLSDFTLVVMDNQNRTVYKTTDPDFKWDGIGLNGQQVPKGNYVYFLTAKDANGAPVNKYNTLTIR